MNVAMGVNMNSKHILPYHPGVKVAYSVTYRSKLSEKAKLKLHCYNLHKYEGLKVTDIAKVVGKDKATIYRWINQTKTALRVRRYQYLEPRSRKPNKVQRKKRMNEEYMQYILKIRKEYKCGKDNIHRYLIQDYGVYISPSTIGRYLQKLPRSKDPKYFDLHSKSKTKRRKRKDLVRIKDVVDVLENRAWERFQIDTKHWVVNNRKFYIIVAIDVVSRMVFARAYSRHTANCARDFLRKLDYLFNVSNSQAYIQRDNGSEFMAEFEEEAKNFNINLLTNYVRCPQMNGFVESFNKILKNECLLYNTAFTTKEANKILRDYLIKYNFLRIHGSIGHKVPFERYLEDMFQDTIKAIENNLPSLSHMLWTYSKKQKTFKIMYNKEIKY